MTTRDDGGLILAAVLDDGPAQAAGLSAGDELVALDGFRIDSATLKERLAAKKPGDRLRCDIFRRDQLRTIEVTLGDKPPERYKIAPVAVPSAAQRALYEQWMGAPLPSADDEDDKDDSDDEA